MGPAGQLVNEQYLGPDWTKGWAGTGEFEWVSTQQPSPDTCMGVLAESWAIPELGTVVFQIRQGVHWALNPNSEASRLVSGREVTLDDWMANFKRLMQHPHSPIRAVPQMASSATMEKTGQWEVTLKTPIDPLIGWNWLARGSNCYFVLPPEVIEKYGDMRDWRNVVGTGPFMLTDFVAGSSTTLVKNPNYWQKDPVGLGEGNRLPYLDGIKILVISDISTVEAAFRTAKIETVTEVPTEGAKGFIQSVPELKYRTYLSGTATVFSMRTDKAELPYKDKRVRQALMMATDFNGLKNDFFGGEADILAFPVTKEANRAYMPLDEMPQSAQALYHYDPDKAKQLLIEAGYPDGFTAKVIVLNSFGYCDLASVYKAMWAKIGVNLEIQPKEMGVWISISYSRAYEDMLLSVATAGSAYPLCLNMPWFRGLMSSSYVNDPLIEAAREEIQKHVIIDMPEADRLHSDLMPYIVEQSYYIPVPSPNVYSLWWPWVKNYYGEIPLIFATYCWIDRDLTEELTGKR